MRDQRIGAVGGLWFVAISIAAGLALPKPPAADASAATIGRYLTGHHERIQTASVASGLAALGLLVLIAALHERLRADAIAAKLTLAGGGLLVTVAVLGSILQATVGVVAGIGQLTSTSSTASGLGLAGFLLTVAWVAATSGVLFRTDAEMRPVAVPATAQ